MAGVRPLSYSESLAGRAAAVPPGLTAFPSSAQRQAAAQMQRGAALRARAAMAAQAAGYQRLAEAQSARARAAAAHRHENMRRQQLQFGPANGYSAYGNGYSAYLPRFRAALYAQGVTLWAAPTVDDRPQWEVAMRHIAHEGRCFLVGACQWLPPSQMALGEPITLIDRPHDAPLIAGGSLIVSPMGEVLAGPLRGGEGLVTAEVDLADIVRARFDFDAAGHYARSDLFGTDMFRLDVSGAAG
jgi:hypothetical protein